jgi:hypothetical protein
MCNRNWRYEHVKGHRQAAEFEQGELFLRNCKEGLELATEAASVTVIVSLSSQIFRPR